MLNIETGDKEFYAGETRTHDYHGVYFEDDVIFFALYASTISPKIYFQNVEYNINNKLNIQLIDENESHRFTISEYGISILYHDSDLLDWDWWSTRESIDIFYIIEQSYKTDEFYDRYTLK